MRSGVLVCFIAQVAVAPFAAFAEVGLPPPAVHQAADNGFPSSQALKNQGYDPSRGVLRVDETNRGAATVKKTGDTITGAQPKSVTATGKYGEKATIGTAATQTVSTGKLQAAANTVIVAGALSNGANKATPYAENAGRALKEGNYIQAARNSVMATGAVIDGFLGGGIEAIAKGIGRGMGTLPSGSASGQSAQTAAQQQTTLREIFQRAKTAQQQAETRGDLAGAVAQAAAAKAANAAVY